MFIFGRGRVPFALPLLFLLAVVGFSLAGQAGSALLLFPIFMLKMFFFFLLAGMVMRLVRGGMPWGGRAEGGPWAPPREPTEEERERAEAMRQAKEEVDRLFPDL